VVIGKEGGWEVEIMTNRFFKRKQRAWNSMTGETSGPKLENAVQDKTTSTKIIDGRSGEENSLYRKKET